MRLSILVGLLAWALLLYKWSREDDPRFYQFVQSPPGKAMAKAFNWYGVIPPPAVEEKSEDKMTSVELDVKRELEETVRAAAPTHRLVFVGGRSITGRLLEDRPDYISFTENYGEEGTFSMKIRRRRILAVEAVTNPPPAISYRDVCFKMEFPAMRFYKRPPYSILTDESYFSIQPAVDSLNTLYEDFMDVFGSLVTSPDRGNGIQVLFFSKYPEFRSYQQQYSGGQLFTAGFYSPWVDRLVVFNQETSDQIERAKIDLQEAEARYRSVATSPENLRRIDAWARDAERNIDRFAREQTEWTLRHEAAHQLFFRLGVHSPNRVENEWLMEGLASYCETTPIGEVEDLRGNILRAALTDGKLIPLDEMVGLRSREGFNSLGPHERVELAYDEAWSLVHFLMQPGYRVLFFNYIMYVRDPRNFHDVRRADPMELLCRFMGFPPEELNRLWTRDLGRL